MRMKSFHTKSNLIINQNTRIIINCGIASSILVNDTDHIDK